MNVVSRYARHLDHVAIAVSSLDAARPFYERLGGVPCSPPETVATQGVRVAFCGQLELLEPLSPDTTVGRYLARRGPGLHHIAFRSDDLAADLATLAAEGVELIDREPRRGARGHLVAFVHPHSTGGVLVELVQQTD
jgi:methylmalonyl-CoA/ethylmalonyl-CoA epimerase